VKSFTAHHQSRVAKQHLFVKNKKTAGERTPVPEKPSLSHFHYGNGTELGPPCQYVTSLDSSGSVKTEGLFVCLLLF